MSHTTDDATDDAAADPTRTITRRALLAAGVFGFGLSALLDTLFLHEVLQLHHLLSGIYPTDTLAGFRANVRADGLFALATLGVAMVGAGLLWRAERRTDAPLAVRPLAGAGLLGLGAFDVFDAVVDHALLGLHRPVGPGGEPLTLGGRYNLHWLAVSLLFVAAGYYLYRSSPRTAPGEEPS